MSLTLHGGEVTVGAFVGEAEDFGEELAGADFVVRGYDGVVQGDGHGSPPVVGMFCKSSISEAWNNVHCAVPPEGVWRWRDRRWGRSVFRRVCPEG